VFFYKFRSPFEYRQLDWVCSRDPEWRKKNGINFQDFTIGFGGHSFSRLSGLGNDIQPCLSDPVIFETFRKNIREYLNEHPECKIIDVSQNDNKNYCKCPKCSAIDEEEGSPSGSIIRFVNALADDIKEDYPNVSIMTFAYEYSRKAPRITKPRDNVIIRLCSIECCFSHPLYDPSCEVNLAFQNDLIEWGKICNHIYIWDYVTNFPHYMTPHPNWRVLLKNMRFFADNHAIGMYPEGNYNSESGEFGELRAYLLGRAMNNPYMTDEEYQEYMNDFLNGYYGKASAPYIRKFIDFTDIQSKNLHLSCWRKPNKFIPLEVYDAHFDEIESWWNEAEKADSGVNLIRVKKSRLQWTYIRLMIRPDEQLACEFYYTAKAHNIHLSEWQDPMMFIGDWSGTFHNVPDFKKAPFEWLPPYIWHE